MKASLLALSLLLLVGCCGRKDATTGSSASGPTAGGEQLSTATVPGVAASPHMLVYRTKRDLQDQVPVMLSKDRKTIASYPHPMDLHTAEGLPLPTRLQDGWLLDNRGIGTNVAFLRTTYAEYAAMEQAPSQAELLGAIEDPDPLTDLCDCGPRTIFTDPVEQINDLIRHDSLFIRCKRLK